MPKTSAAASENQTTSINKFHVLDLHDNSDEYDRFWINGKIICQDSSHCSLQGVFGGHTIQKSHGTETFVAFIANRWEINIENAGESFLILPKNRTVKIRCGF